MITKEQLRFICFDRIIPKWHSMPDTFPDFLREFSQDEKDANGELVSQLLERLRDMPDEPSEEQREQIKGELAVFLEKEQIIHAKKYISDELMDEFRENIELFIKKTKAFDESLSRESIWQAMRNYLIYAIIVNLQGQRQNCRDTILGYSLLYPYTDNYIDRFHRGRGSRDSYNALIRRVLTGQAVCPQDDYEEKTRQLLELVLDHYSGDPEKRKEAAALLLLMLDAQEKSIRQMRRFGAAGITADEILRISSYKGGVSVFLDYLFGIDLDESSMTEAEMAFYLSFGLILQLADDLQDIKEDRKNRIRTLMTFCRCKRRREATVNRLLHFTQSCITDFHPKNPELKPFVLQNCRLLLLTAVAQNAKCFSGKYMKKVEPYLPLSLKQIKSYSEKL